MDYIFTASINGEVPTKELIEQLFEKNPTEINMLSDWCSYEGNISFAHAQVKWEEVTLDFSGYNALWELMHPEKLNKEAYEELVRNLKGWLLEELDCAEPWYDQDA